MSTYRKKIRKYEARVRKAMELGLEPREEDISKLYYYVSRAEKKGLDHKTKFKDKVHTFTKGLEKNLPALLEATMSDNASRRVQNYEVDD